MFDTAAAIIGGGAATRFGGRDKSRLVIGGLSIINRQAAALQPLVDEIFVVASQNERFADTPWRVVADEFPGTGVVGAIATALGERISIRELAEEELRTFGDPARLLANINSPDDLGRIEGS